MLSQLRNLSKVAGPVRAALASQQYASAGIASSAVAQDKIVAVLYKAGEASQEKRLLGCVENELGLRSWLEEKGHTYIVTDDKEGPDCELEKHLPDADIIITTPFHPGYLTPDRLDKAKKLKLALTAGIGSDHVDLPSAAKNGVTVAEITGSNVVSVAEHVVMMILALVRNYMTAHRQVIDGKWHVADIAKEAFDLEGKTIGTIGAGRIGQRVLERLVPFKPGKLLYSDYAQLPKEREQQLQAEYVSMEDLVKQCDVVTINCPLHKETEGMFNKRLIDMMKPKSYVVNTARGAIANRDDIVDALKSGQLAGYAGDVWYPQPAPADHPWRSMPKQAMTPHYSGTTLDAQMRYAAGTKEILRRYFEGEKLNPTDVIVEGGKMAAQYDSTVKAEGRSLEFKEEWEKINKPSGPASGAKS